MVLAAGLGVRMRPITAAPAQAADRDRRAPMLDASWTRSTGRCRAGGGQRPLSGAPIVSAIWWRAGCRRSGVRRGGAAWNWRRRCQCFTDARRRTRSSWSTATCYGATGRRPRSRFVAGTTTRRMAGCCCSQWRPRWATTARATSTSGRGWPAGPPSERIPLFVRRPPNPATPACSPARRPALLAQHPFDRANRGGGCSASFTAAAGATSVRPPTLPPAASVPAPALALEGWSSPRSSPSPRLLSSMPLAAGLRLRLAKRRKRWPTPGFLLPTRRACRALTMAFVRQSKGRPLLLPRMTPLGDIDDDDLGIQRTRQTAGARPPPAVPAAPPVAAGAGG